MGSSVLPYINKYYQTELFPVLADDCIYLFYYLCGYLFVHRDNAAKDEKKTRSSQWVIPVLVVLLAAGMAAGRVRNFMQIQMAYEYPFTVVLSVLIFAWAAGCKRDGLEQNKGGAICGETAEKHWVAASDLCFAIYLIHPLFINISYKFLHVTPWNYPLVISFPVFWLVFLLLSVIAAWGLRQVPVLRKYVL